jgi:hypothetical protein
MRVLFIYCNSFEYKPTIQTLDFVEQMKQGAKYENVQTAFIQVEKEDEEREASVLKKLVKNIKWLCGKNENKHIVLHSFAHLSESKADPAFTRALFDKVQAKLENVDYQVEQTPFGYFLDLKVDAPGFSLARVYKEL